MCKSTVVNEQVNKDDGTHWVPIHGPSVGWTTFFLLFCALCAFLICSCLQRNKACRNCMRCMPCGCCPLQSALEEDAIAPPAPRAMATAPFPLTASPFNPAPVFPLSNHKIPVTRAAKKKSSRSLLCFLPLFYRWTYPRRLRICIRSLPGSSRCTAATSSSSGAPSTWSY